MLYVVIPVHNRRGVTCRCLASIQPVLLPEIAVVVVDDGSSDGTAAAVREQFPWAHVLPGDGNLWWSGGVNLGIQYALNNAATAVVTLNDDTLVTDGFFAAMLDHHRRHPSALFGALELDAQSGEIFHSGERINWWTGTVSRPWGEIPLGELNGLAPVTHLNGRGLLIPAEVFQQIGLFDERRLPQRGADFDFTHRARRAGFGVYCAHDARLLVFPEMHSGHVLRQKRSLMNYWRHLFTWSGEANLRVFTTYALKNCPVVCLPSFMAIGYTRRLFGYWGHRRYGRHPREVAEV